MIMGSICISLASTVIVRRTTVPFSLGKHFLQILMEKELQLSSWYSVLSHENDYIEIIRDANSSAHPK